MSERMHDEMSRCATTKASQMSFRLPEGCQCAGLPRSGPGDGTPQSIRRPDVIYGAVHGSHEIKFGPLRADPTAKETVHVLTKSPNVERKTPSLYTGYRRKREGVVYSGRKRC